MSARREKSPLETQDKVEENIELLKIQDSRLVSEYKANLLETQARKYWDQFYKRNETRFFRDRHWTTREFTELLGDDKLQKSKKVLFEIGCGVGNFIYPLVEENLNLHIFACDLSPRAVDFAKANSLYDSSKMTIFQCDITQSDEVFKHIQPESVDIVTLIFVLSAIHPDKFLGTLQTLHNILKPSGLILFRDYGLFDMAQLRFKPGSKISENFYMRQDGTRSYFFSLEFTQNLFERAGFKLLVNSYVHRRTVNKKEDVDVGRIFVQVKAKK